MVLHPHASLEMKLNPSVFYFLLAAFFSTRTGKSQETSCLPDPEWHLVGKITHTNKTVNKEFKGAVLLNFSDLFLSSGSLVVQPPQWLSYTNNNNKKWTNKPNNNKKNNPLDTLFDKMDSRPINTRLGFLLTGWMQNQKKIETDITWNAKANWNLNNWLEEKATDTIAFTFVVCPLLIKNWVMGGPIKPTTNWEAPMVACSVKQHIYSSWNTT